MSKKKFWIFASANSIAEDIKADDVTAVFKRPSRIREIWRRLAKNKLAMAGFIIILVILAFVLSASLIAPYEEAITMNMENKLQSPSIKHLFGTDSFGRDILVRCLHGGRISLAVSVGASVIAVVLGALIGASVGYFGGMYDTIVMRILDLVGSVPTILLAMAVVAALGSGAINIGISLIIASVPIYVRVLRSVVLGISDQEYISAARAGGVGHFRIITKHVIPNTIGLLIVGVTMNVAQLILAVASLSFLGMGVNPPQPEWGAMVNESREYLRQYPYLMLFPAAMIGLSSFALNVLGDGLRDALDPRLRT